jgi:hypothetical protein
MSRTWELFALGSPPLTPKKKASMKSQLAIVQVESEHWTSPASTSVFSFIYFLNRKFGEP